MDTVSDVDFRTLSSSLNATEKARAARFHFAADRRNFVTTRALLRDLLGTVLRTAPGGLEFKYGAHGKPRLVSDAPGERIHFNLSHCAGWALFAVGTDRELGVDLESASRLDQDDETLSRLAARILSARELGVWKTLTSMAARRAAFLRAWTRKEAYLKATGRGFSDPFQSVEMILDAHAPNEWLSIESRPRRGNSSWLVHDLAAPEGFAAALAVEQSAVKSSAPELEST